MTSWEEELSGRMLPFSQFQVITYHQDRSVSLRAWNLGKRDLRVIEALLGEPDGEGMIDSERCATSYEAAGPGMTVIRREG